MPEGPEVKTLVTEMGRYIGTSKLLDIEFVDDSYRQRFDGQNRYYRPLCQGKFIYWESKDSEVYKFIWQTLGLAGWVYDSEKDYCRYIMHFEDGKSLYYCDPRKFGKLYANKSVGDTLAKFNTLGPCPLRSFSPELYAQDMHRRLDNYQTKRTVAQVLLDQKYFCGVGNYLKSEILYECGISPHRPWNSLAGKDIGALIDETYNLSRTFYLYSDQPKELMQKVYRKETDPNGHKVYAEKTKDNRTSYWVPALQG